MTSGHKPKKMKIFTDVFLSFFPVIIRRWQVELFHLNFREAVHAPQSHTAGKSGCSMGLLDFPGRFVAWKICHHLPSQCSILLSPKCFCFNLFKCLLDNSRKWPCFQVFQPGGYHWAFAAGRAPGELTWLKPRLPRLLQWRWCRQSRRCAQESMWFPSVKVHLRDEVGE